MDGVIATSDAEKYCYYYSEATREVTYAAKPQPAEDCSQPGLAGAPRKPLNNPQIVYSVNSYARPGTTVAVRAPPGDTLKATIALDDTAVGNAARHLQQERFGYDGDIAKAQSNIKAFGQALGEGRSALPAELQGESHDQSLVRLPASRAIEILPGRSPDASALVSRPTSASDVSRDIYSESSCSPLSLFSADGMPAPHWGNVRLKGTLRP
jgi:hypothetical protein